MKQKPDTAQKAAEYTMGIKFQMRVNMDETLVKETCERAGRRAGKILLAAGAAGILAGMFLWLSKSAATPGILILFLGVIAAALGASVKSWYPKAGLFLLKIRKKDGTFKVTVFETEFLIYSEQYQTSESLSLKNMLRWEKVNGIYRIYLPGRVFAFRENEFLGGNAAAFELFLNETGRKNN